MTPEKEKLLKKLAETPLPKKALASGKKITAKESAAVKEFIRHFYNDIALRDLKAFDVETLQHMALSMWNFLQERKPNETKVRTYNPDLKKDGWESDYTFLEVVIENKPFLVDSTTNALIARNLTPKLFIHPIQPIVRDAKNKLVPGVHEQKDNERALQESCVQILLPKVAGAKRLKEVNDTIKSVMEDVNLSVDDWLDMKTALKRVVYDLDNNMLVNEQTQARLAIDFLEWLNHDNFIFFGYREYTYTDDKKGEAGLKVNRDSSLGILKRNYTDEEKRKVILAHPHEIAAFKESPDVLLIAKSSRSSTIHRTAYMDIVSVKHFDSQGQVVGEHRFVGLFTSRAYSTSVFSIPLLKEKVESVVEASGYPKATHNRKALVHIMETFPRDNMFQIEEDELLRIAKGILQMQDRKQTAVFVHEDRFDRYISCLIYLPREVVSTHTRLSIEKALLEEMEGGAVQNYFMSITEQRLARYHYNISFDGGIPKYDFDKLEERIRRLTESWSDRFLEALNEIMEHSDAEEMFHKYSGSFSLSYQENNAPEVAAHDIEALEDISDDQPYDVCLMSQESDQEVASLHVRLAHIKRPVPISEVVPILENMGLKVIAEMTYEIAPPQHKDSVWVHDFNIIGGGVFDSNQDTEAQKIFEQAFCKVWNGEAENDGFNGLSLRGGLRWDQIQVLRAYQKYLKQSEFPLTKSAIIKTFMKHPFLACKLVSLFELKFDPALKGNRKTLVNQKKKDILDALDSVSNINEDRVLRGYLEVINATIRTNKYQPENPDLELPEKPLSLKMKSADISFLPSPKPMFEIYVYSPRVEGVHLRGGKVARGGLRWSDRQDDFRTEVLGLMKAQMVKNTVIVPVGSKGGFVCKKMPSALASRDEVMKEVVTCYRLFISGLLDITDNLQGTKIQPPKEVVRHDADDPYLVVAADKGTATFSDIANDLSLKYGFWLGDAFASGGSAGYDHKAMGITAKGAWVSVQRHFREMGLNTQTDPFTVIGVGDMSGDVFGNGMILSDKIKLVAAFNHKHIFLDPDPNPETSFKERKRIFELDHPSSWDEYNTSYLSKGGAIYSRSDKSLKLTPEIKKLLKVRADKMAPSELIHGILQSSADLFWMGGIGTYVKASKESHAEADDRTNDSLRVDANKLKVKVVGEGANLGFTQRARIEFAQKGGKINTDAIDNSAGVDCSDKEVNIKIVLNKEMAEERLSLDKRNHLLVKMTDDVSRLVLRDNYLQTQNISYFTHEGAKLMETHRRHMVSLEKRGLLNRPLERLPDNDTIEERITAYKGLTRPEYAVLLAYAKIDLYNTVLDTDLVKEKLLDEDLLAYFPETMSKMMSEKILTHHLRDEIVATILSNQVLNRMGASFVFRVHENVNAPAEEIVKAYLIANRLFGLETLFKQIESLDYKTRWEDQRDMLQRCVRLAERVTLWFLKKMPAPLDVKQIVGDFEKPAHQVAENFINVVQSEYAGRMKRYIKTYQKQGVDEKTAGTLAALSRLHTVCDIVQVADTHKINVMHTAQIYFKLRADFKLDWLVQQAWGLDIENDWQRRALDMLMDDLTDFQAKLAASVAPILKNNSHEDVLKGWYDSHQDSCEKITRIMQDLKEMKRINMSALTLSIGNLRNIAERLDA